LVFPAQEGSRLQDISARGSAAYDLFGDGKTALKVSLGKYVIAQDNTSAPQGVAAAPMARIALSTARSWSDANRNFVPDCDLISPLANGECGAIANQNFGKSVFSTTYDPAILTGWGVRPYNWAFDVSVQREILPRISASAGYFRRWFGNFVATVNRATPAADYTFFNVPVPADPRLPISGVVKGFFDVVPAKFGLVDNLITAASNYGNIRENWNGVDVGINARLRQLVVQGGVGTGRASKDLCDVAAKVPSALLTAYESGGVGTPGRAIPMAYCKMTQAFQTGVKFLGAYTVPRIDVQVAATLQNLPGLERVASYNAPNAVVAPLLGRNLSGSAANINLQLLPPQAYYSGDRINQVDFRVSKILRMHGKRLQASLDLFNALNDNTTLTVNQTYIPTGTWEIPTRILPARLVKVTGQIDF
jgi:hypothetical protein